MLGEKKFSFLPFSFSCSGKNPPLALVHTIKAWKKPLMSCLVSPESFLLLVATGCS
jgi:hypothetical protein